MASEIVGGLTAVAKIASAVGETKIMIRKMKNKHKEKLAVMSYQHQQAMTVLNNERNRENNRHEEFMKILEILNNLQLVSINSP